MENVGIWTHLVRTLNQEFLLPFGNWWINFFNLRMGFVFSRKLYIYGIFQVMPVSNLIDTRRKASNSDLLKFREALCQQGELNAKVYFSPAILHVVVYICQCYFLLSSRPLLTSLYPQVHSLYLCLHCFPADRFINTLWLICSPQQKPSQQCKATLFQLKNKLKKEATYYSIYEKKHAMNISMKINLFLLFQERRVGSKVLWIDTFVISISLKICSTHFLVNRTDVVNQNTTKYFFCQKMNMRQKQIWKVCTDCFFSISFNPWFYMESWFYFHTQFLLPSTLLIPRHFYFIHVNNSIYVENTRSTQNLEQ